MMLFHDIPLHCINDAAINFHVPAAIIVSVIQAENGKNGQAVRNSNGSYDLGVMQINTVWLKSLAEKGITAKAIQHDPCVNVKVGAWILAQGLAKSTGWQGVGNYHSYTEKHNKVYRQKIKHLFQTNTKFMVGVD